MIQKFGAKNVINIVKLNNSGFCSTNEEINLTVHWKIILKLLKVLAETETRIIENCLQEASFSFDYILCVFRVRNLR